MFKQCSIYFGFEDGELVQTAFVPATSKSDAGADKEEPK